MVSALFWMTQHVLGVLVEALSGFRTSSPNLVVLSVWVLA